MTTAIRVGKTCGVLAVDLVPRYKKISVRHATRFVVPSERGYRNEMGTTYANLRNQVLVSRF